MLFHQCSSIGIQSAIARCANLCERQPVHFGQKPGKHRQWFHAQIILAAGFRQHALCIAGQDKAEQATDCAAIGQAKHIAHLRSRNLAIALHVGMGNGLVEYRQTVAYGALGGLGHQCQRLNLGLNMFFGSDVSEMVRQFCGGNTLEIKPLTPRQYGNRNLVHFGRRKQEFDVTGRFFERLQQRVKRVFRQHVDFVDDVNFIACRNRRIAHSLNNLTHIVNTGVARCIHFDDIDMAAFGNGNAWLASTAGINRRATLPVRTNAVQCLGNQSRRRCFTDTANASHQKRMRQSIALDRIAKRLHHRILANKFSKGLGTVFAGKYAVGRAAGICRSRYWRWCRGCGSNGRLRNGRQIQAKSQSIIGHIRVAFCEFWAIGIGHHRYDRTVTDLCRSFLKQKAGKSRSRMTRSEFVVAASVRI